MVTCFNFFDNYQIALHNWCSSENKKENTQIYCQYAESHGERGSSINQHGKKKWQKKYWLGIISQHEPKLFQHHPTNWQYFEGFYSLYIF